MKDLEISKELIKNVLAKEIECLSDGFIFNIEGNYILFADDGELQFEVNIYEFAFKCKEWALSENYSLMSRGAREYDICSQWSFKEVGLCKVIINSNPNMGKHISLGSTELEAIIDASNWILENNK